MRLVAALLFLLAACASPVAPTPPPAPPPSAATHLDTLARDFVRLALEIGTHEEGYIDAYYGPPELKTEAEAHPRSVAELKTEADRIVAALEHLDVSHEENMVRMREARLLTYAHSARFRLDMIEGTRAPFVEEAQKLFGLTPMLKPLADYDPILARIARLAPGRGPLAERIVALKARYVIPPGRLQAVMDAAIGECRRRTLAHYTLPANENFRMEFVTHQSWGAYNYYQGNAQSLIQVNTDLPIYIDRALALGCHEGDPGHHVQGIMSEKLYKERGWVEFAIAPLFSPQGPLDEGGANFGIDLAFPGVERLAFERDTLYPLAGLNPRRAARYNDLRVALNQLSGARLTIAQMYLDGEINRTRAVALTQRYQLISRARAEQSIAFTDHYRSYVINYATGEDLVRAYAMRAPDAAGQWAAYLRVISEPTLPADLQ